MARDGNGSYSLPEAAFVYDTVIDETAVNSNFSDIASALTASIAKDGQTVPTANLPMGTYRHTGVGNASARDQYAAMGQIQDGGGIWCGTAGGTADALTLTPTPAITAYAAGQRFEFKAGAASNTGAVTFAISGLSTIAGQVRGAACVAGDIAANQWYRITLSDANTAQIEPLGEWINGTAIGSGKVPQWNGSAWVGVTPGAGTVTSIVAGTGLTGGTITSTGTIAVDVGTTASKIVQLDGSAKLPAVDGSQLTGISSTDQIALDMSAITAARLMYTTSISDGSLGQGYQWELSSDTWGGTSTNETFTSATPNYYTNGSTGYTADTIPTMTGYTTPSGTASASNDGNGAAWHAFDKSTGSVGVVWQTTTTSGWLEYEFSSSKTITKYTILGGYSSLENRSPRDWTFEAYNGSTWVTLDTRSSQTSWTSGVYNTYTFSNSTAYTRYRINVSANNGGTYLMIDEMTMHETTTPSNMTLIPPSSISVTSAPSVIDCRFAWKDDSGSAVVGTDLTVDLSRDGGTTWTAATVTTIGGFDSTYSYLKARATVSGQPSGTSMLCRIKTLNNKAQRVALPSLNKEY